jgi:hypothetical protein
MSAGYASVFGDTPCYFHVEHNGGGDFSVGTADIDGPLTLIASCIPSASMAILLMSFLNEAAENAGCLLDEEEVSK